MSNWIVWCGAFGFSLTLLFAATPKSEACRFNVRDVGFVDFGQDNYTLYGFVNSHTSSDSVETFDRVAFAALLDSNIQYELIRVDEMDIHPGLEYFSEAQLPTLPAAVLVSPRGGAWPVTFDSVEPDAYREHVWTTLEGLVRSPTRERLLDLTLDTYGVVLVVEGENANLNRAAHQAADEAIATIERGMGALEKPIERPPVKVTLTREEAAAEDLLLWGVGIEGDLDEPYAVVIYGRGRRMMDSLKGERITSARLANNMRLVGLNCECGLDRSVMVGQMFPLYWGSERRAQVVQNLGFDAESPMIKTEISQIIAIGQRNIQGAARGAGVSSIDELVLGYNELSVQEAAALPIPGEPVGVARDMGDSRDARDGRGVESSRLESQEPLAASTQDAGIQPETVFESSIVFQETRPNWMLLAFIALAGIGGLVVCAAILILIIARSRNA